MIQQNRTYLLQLKGKQAAITGNLHILKARRHALIMEFIKSSQPYLRNRDEIRELYGRGLLELHLAAGVEGAGAIASLAGISGRDDEVGIAPKNILGIRYKQIEFHGAIVRSPEERGYDWRGTAPHVEESYHLFERVVEAMVKLASFEQKIRKLGEEIIKISRRTRVLEERIMPGLKGQIKKIAHAIGERDREEFYRLKKFKEIREGREVAAWPHES